MTVKRKATPNDAPRRVEVRVEIRQLKTMADGTINLILNLPEDCREQAKVIMDWLGLEAKAVIYGPTDD